ncbi:penicillin acylase family protein [Thiocapsa bogorovii]|uniref:penicillin acylase family protein n=1 Tax=Thiocapsa bogorovii TaxID=521689 RepID=UPI001E2D0196|nr:penicillin acylase family protein [Thiocapsa bogorovii]UHD17878.1 penicillin acylase family protein [Thiocapsa bogorovii]
MKIRILRLLFGVASVGLITGIAAWWLIRGSLPVLNGELPVTGLGHPATIERDEQGVPTIRASTRRDLAFATGFVHGQDRFFQMDMIRRQAAGELSEMFGAAALPLDKRYRFHRFRARAQAALQTLTQPERAILDAYASGVNAGLGSLSVRPFEYLLLREQPKAWGTEETLLVVYAMFMQLNDDRARGDVQRGLAKSVLPTNVYAWLYPAGTTWDAPIVGGPIEPVPIPEADDDALRGVELIPNPATEQDSPALAGSNNWAVGGALTDHGRALVSNDMHLGLSVPNIYYRARLITTGEGERDVTGVSLPGTPFVVAGSNGRVAWGYTNSYGDWSDAVVLRPGAAAGTYRTPDGDEAFVEHREWINVKRADPVEYRIRETRWGPVDEGNRFAGSEVAVRWLAHSPRALNLSILDLETVADLEAGLDVANTIGMPPQNFVAGDAHGNIGWTIAGRIPVKSGYDPMVPADWSTGGGWTGWLDAADYPRVINPESHRIWTANARVLDGDALRKIGDGGYDLGARAKQIRDRLFEKDLFTPEDMLKIQRDHEALFLGRWRTLLLEVLVSGGSEMDEYRLLVENWIPAASVDSVGYRLVRAFRLQVRQKVFAALTTPVRDVHGENVDLLISHQFEAPLWSILTEKPRHLLPADVESWDALMLAAVRENIDSFEKRFEGALSQRTWGELNTARIAHPISQAVPWLSGWLDMPREALPGDANLPLAQSPDFGAAQRFSVSPGDEANGLMQMPTGQSGHPMSPFYRRGHEDWVSGTPSPFLPGPTRHQLTLKPAR